MRDPEEMVMSPKVRSSPKGMGPLIAYEFTAMSKSDRQSFANHLDKMLTKYASSASVVRARGQI